MKFLSHFKTLSKNEFEKYNVIKLRRLKLKFCLLLSLENSD